MKGFVSAAEHQQRHVEDLALERQQLSGLAT
jgi:hypothetical protein